MAKANRTICNTLGTQHCHKQTNKQTSIPKLIMLIEREREGETKNENIMRNTK